MPADRIIRRKFWVLEISKTRMIPTQKMYFGTAIYNGAATSTVTFSDIPSGYTYVIATCQDAGTAILVASLSGTSLKVIFSNQITIARVNFLLLTA